jgi:hypothetical protein
MNILFIKFYEAISPDNSMVFKLFFGVPPEVIPLHLCIPKAVGV